MVKGKVWRGGNPAGSALLMLQAEGVAIHARPDRGLRRARSRQDRFAPPTAVAFGQS